MPPPANMSFLELMEGVGKGHRALASIPGAQRMPLIARQQQVGMKPAEVVEQYNKLGAFGKTESGEPVRAVLSARMDRDLDKIRRGGMPHDGLIRLYPESKVPKKLEDASVPEMTRSPQVSWSPGATTRSTQPMTQAYEQRMRDTQYGRGWSSFGPPPEMLEMYAMNVKPYARTPQWYSNLPSKGKELYSLAYDLMRAQGLGNTAPGLTDVNKARRLGNVASHALGHGDTGFIVPFSEPGHGFSHLGESPSLFGYTLGDITGEEKYLNYMLSKWKDKDKRKHGEELYQQAQALLTPDFLKASDDAILGTLLTREAQLAGVYGPPTGTPGSFSRLRQVMPYDTGALRAIAEPQVTANPGELAGAFGPATLGRQSTTEMLIRSIMSGMDPEDVIEETLKVAPPGSFRNRYAKGGLASAALLD